MPNPEAADNVTPPLSTAELRLISEEISCQFAPTSATALPLDAACAPADLLCPNPVFTSPVAEPDATLALSASEILTISNAVCQAYQPTPAAPNPELLLLPVDPYSVYAYWQGDAKPSLPALTLRVYWRLDADPSIPDSNVWFDITLPQNGQRQKISVPIDDSFYSAALGYVYPDYRFTALAHSNIVHIPTAGQRLSTCTTPQATQSTADTSAEQPALHTSLQPTFNPEHHWSIKLHHSPPVSIIQMPIQDPATLLPLLHTHNLSIQLITDTPPLEKSTRSGKYSSGQGIH